MSPRNPFAKPTAASIGAHVRRHAAKMPAHAPHHDGASASLREADYKGHHIVVRTTYDIQVDGRAVTGHMGVTDDGRVHYHPVPNVSFPSALDMVRRLIDVFPDDFGADAEPGGHGGDGGHDGHSHDGHEHVAPLRRKSAARGVRPPGDKRIRPEARRAPRRRRR